MTAQASPLRLPPPPVPALLDCISCPPGLIQVWILLLEQLTAAVSNCPRQHQPPTLELLFALLREVTVVPGQTPYLAQPPPTPPPGHCN